MMSMATTATTKATAMARARKILMTRDSVAAAAVMVVAAAMAAAVVAASVRQILKP